METAIVITLLEVLKDLGFILIYFISCMTWYENIHTRKTRVLVPTHKIVKI